MVAPLGVTLVVLALTAAALADGEGLAGTATSRSSWPLGTRESLMADYDLILRHNMQELSESFGQALELDLIGPDDFALAS